MNNTVERTSEIKTTAVFSKDSKHRYKMINQELYVNPDMFKNRLESFSLRN